MVRCDLSVRRADTTWPVAMMMMIFLTQLSDWQCSNLNVFGRVSRMRDAEEKQCLCLCVSVGDDKSETHETRDATRRDREERREKSEGGVSSFWGVRCERANSRPERLRW